MKKYIWFIILALVYVYEKWDEIAGTPEPSKTGALDFWKPAPTTGSVNPPATPIPNPTPAPSVGNSQAYQLAETSVSFAPSGAGVVDWNKYGAFSLNANESAIAYGIPLGSDLSKVFGAGVTQVSEFDLSGRGVSLAEVPKSRRMKMIQANAMPAPWTSNKSPETIGNMTDAQIDALTDNHLGGGYDWASIDFEPNEDTPDRADKWAYIRNRIGARLKANHGVLHINAFDVTPRRAEQWGRVQGALQAGNIHSVTNCPYVYLDTWVQDPDGVWRAVETWGGFGVRTEEIAERKRTQWKWLYKHVHEMQLAAQVSPVDCIGWFTWGWAQGGFPTSELMALRPDMAKAASVFGLMFPKSRGTGFWGEGLTPNFPLQIVDRWVEGNKIMAQHNAMRTGARQYVTPLLSFDNGASWAQPGTEENRQPVAAGITKGNEILIALNDPNLFSGTRQCLVKHGEFIAPAILRANDTTVFKGSKETNF